MALASWTAVPVLLGLETVVEPVSATDRFGAEGVSGPNTQLSHGESREHEIPASWHDSQMSGLSCPTQSPSPGPPGASLSAPKVSAFSDTHERSWGILGPLTTQE